MFVRRSDIRPFSTRFGVFGLRQKVIAAKLSDEESFNGAFAFHLVQEASLKARLKQLRAAPKADPVAAWHVLARLRRSPPPHLALRQRPVTTEVKT